MKVTDQLFTMHGTGLWTAIRCPRCGREAALEDASVRLHGPAARAAADDASVTGVWAGGAYLVVRYPKLLSWNDLSAHGRRGEMWGICRCGHCGLLRGHRLEWPADAYYAASIRGRTLWAWTREHVLALRAFVASGGRSTRGLPYGIAKYVKRVPREFLLAKNRDEVVKRLDELLADGPAPRARPSRPDPLTPAPLR